MDIPDVTSQPLDLAAIGGRIREMISAVGSDGTEFAIRVGVPYSTMRSYLSGNRAPSPEFLVGAFKVYGYMPSWLLTGELPIKSTDTRQSDADLQGDFVSIPLLGITASAGNGQLNEPEATYRIDGLAFSKAWLAKRNLSAPNLRVIEVKGASMQGVLSDGDRVLIDLSDNRPRSGLVYVLRQGDELLVKYCQLLPGGTLRVSSANPQFAPYDVQLDQAPDLAIVGRVVASMHEW
jgi:phage repressor protein C with HTH and peptisase S24 domain